MADEWHYTNDGSQQGPVSASELKQLAASGSLSPSDLVWKEGMAEWKPASSVKGLFLSPATPGKLPPTTPAKQPPPIQPNQSPPSLPPNPYLASRSDDLVMPSNPPKDPIVMAACSFFIPWLGHLLMGQVAKGIVMFFAVPVLLGTLLAFGGMIGIFSVVSSAISVFMFVAPFVVAGDAFMIGRTLKSGQPVGKWQFFPGIENRLGSLSPQHAEQTTPERPQKTVVPKPDGFMSAAIAMFVPAVTALLWSIFGMIELGPRVRDMTGFFVYVSFAYNAWVIFGTFMTTRLANYKLAQATSYMVFGCWAIFLLTRVPFGISMMGIIISVPIGIWSQMVLRRDEVQAAFERTTN